MRSTEPSLAKFSGALADYELGLYTQELQGEPGKRPPDRGKHLLDELLNTPTPCVRDAAAAEGQFPLVIYHAGGTRHGDDCRLQRVRSGVGW
jgi:hypothetical protein